MTFYYIGLIKKCLQILSKKTHFSFSPRTLLNNVFTILFYYLLPFFRQLDNSMFPKRFIFLSRDLFQVPFLVSWDLKLLFFFFHNENFVKTKINGNPKLQYLVNTNESELPLFGFLEGAHNRGLSSNSAIYTILPSLYEDWPLMW